MDFLKPFKTEPIKPYIPTVQKCVDEKVILPKQAVDFLKTLKTAATSDDIDSLLQKNTHENLNPNTYKTDNIIFYKTDYVIADMATTMIQNINSFNVKSVPKILYRFDNNEIDKVLVFSLNTKDKLVPFNPLTATDRAKTEFYEDIKKLADKKCIDFENIQDSTNWFQTADGTQIYVLDPNIGGYLEDSKIEKLKQNVFNTLFNNK